LLHQKKKVVFRIHNGVVQVSMTGGGRVSFIVEPSHADQEGEPAAADKASSSQQQEAYNFSIPTLVLLEPLSDSCALEWKGERGVAIPIE
jgi:hypothetical protein